MHSWPACIQINPCIEREANCKKAVWVFQCSLLGSPSGSGEISSHLTDKCPYFPTSYSSSQQRQHKIMNPQPSSPWDTSSEPSLAVLAGLLLAWAVPGRGSQGWQLWLVKKALVSLHTGLTHSGQHRVSWREHTSLDCRWEHTRSARACRERGKAQRGQIQLCNPSQPTLGQGAQVKNHLETPNSKPLQHCLTLENSGFPLRDSALLMFSTPHWTKSEEEKVKPLHLILHWVAFKIFPLHSEAAPKMPSASWVLVILANITKGQHCILLPKHLFFFSNICNGLNLERQTLNCFVVKPVQINVWLPRK